MDRLHRLGLRVAIVSMVVSLVLSITKILIGLRAGSASVIADGVESGGDVLASGLVCLGLMVAAKPPDANHPYGHGRLETLSGLIVGLLLAATGSVICYRSLHGLSETHAAPELYAIWPLIGSVVVKAVLATLKFRYGRRTRSSGLVADAWNDSVDILSGTVALCAVSLTLYNPSRFLMADHFGAFAVGIIVFFLGLRVMYETAMQLIDTMPSHGQLAGVLSTASTVPGVLGVEKCYARKTGLQYHVDLHLEVDPSLTVRESHDIATQVRICIKESLPWVADVLIHVEPFPSMIESCQTEQEEETQPPN